MSDIDTIIARSRASGGFKKKGYFTLASQKAKTKVSQYALPSPYYYCLEFIQSAVAIGAIYVDVSSSDNDCTISFEGAHYSRNDLEYLFDFLVTDREEEHFRARRRLGIGIASALSLAGSKVVIESGDGTIEGSTRFELEEITEPAVIGQPPEPIGGTYIKVERGARRGVYGPTVEDDLVHERCVHLPINFRVGGQVTFSPGRTLGPDRRYRAEAVRFDEGDLYGWLHRKARDDIKLLTDGVWIDSIRLPRPYPGGVIGYERLHKTASQYAIAKDDRIEELKQRLKPHVDELLRDTLADKRRLKFLCDKPEVELTCVGKTFAYEVVDETGERWAKAKFRLCPSLKRNCMLNVVRKGHRGRVDAVTIPYEFPVLGELELDTLTLDMIRFREPGDNDFLPMYTVGLIPDVYQRFYSSSSDQQAAMLAHFERQAATHLASQVEDEEPAQEEPAEEQTEEVEVGELIELGSLLADGDPEHELERVITETVLDKVADTEDGGLIDLQRLKWLGGLDGESPDTFIPDLLLDVADGGQEAEAPTEPEEVSQPANVPPPPFPTLKYVRQVLAGARVEAEQDEAVLHTLARFFAACSFKHVRGNGYDAWRCAIALVREPDGPPVWSEPLKAGEDSNQLQPGAAPLGSSRLIVNLASGLVRDCLERAAEIPEEFYVLPILVFHEYRRTFATTDLEEFTLLKTVLNRVGASADP